MDSPDVARLSLQLRVGTITADDLTPAQRDAVQLAWLEDYFVRLQHRRGKATQKEFETWRRAQIHRALKRSA